MRLVAIELLFLSLLHVHVVMTSHASHLIHNISPLVRKSQTRNPLKLQVCLKNLTKTKKVFKVINFKD